MSVELDVQVYSLVQSKMAKKKKKTDLGLLEEDDEFEEFPAEGTLLLFWTEICSLEIPHGSRQL